MSEHKKRAFENKRKNRDMKTVRKHGSGIFNFRRKSDCYNNELLLRVFSYMDLTPLSFIGNTILSFSSSL